MSDKISRRVFASATGGLVMGSAAMLTTGTEAEADQPKPTGPVESPFTRDYPPPQFKASWKNPQINKVLVQDFVIYAHSDLPMTKKLLEKEPMLVNAVMDWGKGDWESGLGGASHMGRRDIVSYLLEHGARMDIFCAAMMGQLEAVRAMITLQPKLVDARGPHGFSLHFHAQVGGPEAEPVLAYLQTVKKVEMKPNPFLKKPDADAGKKKT